MQNRGKARDDSVGERFPGREAPGVLGSEIRLQKVRRVQALEKVTFKAERGEVIAILGENGAGKTTLANVLFGRYRADSGNVWSKTCH